MMDDGLDPNRWRDVYAEDELAAGQMVNVDIGRHSIVLTRTPTCGCRKLGRARDLRLCRATLLV